MKTYKVEIYKSDAEWLKARYIGGTDLAKLVNRVSRWGNFIELYDSLKNGKIEKVKPNAMMQRGKLAEDHIRQLFLLSHQELTNESPALNNYLIRRTDYPEITLSPDTLVIDRKGNHGFIEIKLKQIFSEKTIAEYMTDLKEQEPQYWWQNIHYYITKADIQFGYLVVAFDLQRKNEKGRWEHDKYIIESLKTTRKDVQDDIQIGEGALVDFITNNLRKNHRPETIIQNQRKEKIEWSKLSNIQILKH